jgi:peptide/nickel transport system ATP-binding protein
MTTTMLSETPLLVVRDLSVAVDAPEGARTLLDRVSIEIGRGEVLGLVGESGSGKSLLCRTLVGLMPSITLRRTGGSILLDGQEIAGADEKALQAIRGARIGMIFQNPTSHLDPVMRIGDQIVEGIRFHQGFSREAAKSLALDIMDQVGFTDPPRQFASHAHEFSGGMRQRAMIAIALACNPEILIADEPTTALDVTIQAQILHLLLDLRARRGLSIILVTHDLGVVAQTCDRIAVMRHGRIVETGAKRQILKAPQADYTRTLIASHPSMPAEPEAGIAIAHCAEARQAAGTPLIEIDDLSVRFAAGGGLLSRRRSVSAVDGVSLQIWPGETVGIVGESGSGKSTLARAMLGLTPATSGHVSFDGTSLRLQRTQALRALRSKAAMVFQDPYNSLNPRMTIGETLAEVLRVQKKIPAEQIPERVNELLDLVELDRSFASRKPRTMSGGQCQRAGIARALAIDPRVIVADECIAALDVTIQAQIVALFRKLVATMDLTLVFIAHDLPVVRSLCRRVIVMHHGRIVEEGLSDDVFAHPREAYTAALIDAIPDIDPDRPLSGRSTPQ